MLQRRTRIGRLYRRLTRRQPNRKAQWGQISSLRHAGGVGYPKPQAHTVFLTLDEETHPQIPLIEEWADPAPGADQPPPAARETKDTAGLFSQTTTTAAIISLMLLFLGCAYAAFAGFVQFHSMTLARWGCWGAITSIVAAGLGIRIATTPARRSWATRFTAISILSLGTLFVFLVSKGFAA